MTDLTTRFADPATLLYLRMMAVATTVFDGAKMRGVDDSGVAAAEYLGLVVVIAAIVAALVEFDLGARIATAIDGAITEIAGTGGG